MFSSCESKQDMGKTTTDSQVKKARMVGKFSNVSLDKETMAYFDTIFQVPNPAIEAMKRDSVYVVRTREDLAALWPVDVKAMPIPKLDFNNLCLVFAPICSSAMREEEIKDVSLMRTKETDPWQFVVNMIQYEDVGRDVETFYPHGIFTIPTEDVEEALLNVVYEQKVRNQINESPYMKQLIGTWVDDTVGIALNFDHEGVLRCYENDNLGVPSILLTTLNYQLNDLTLTISSQVKADVPFSYNVEIQHEVDDYNNIFSIHLDAFSLNGNTFQSLTLVKK